MGAQQPASEHTRRAHAAAMERLPFHDTADFDDARRGKIADLPDGGLIKSADGSPVWDLANSAVADAVTHSPDTVHPSLWRQAQLLGISGLFEVVDGIYQVRGADLSSITFIEGPDGVVAVDPHTAIETTRAALDLYREHRGDREIVAVIYTHSHVDHYAGVRGIVDGEDVESGAVRVVAPEGFVQNTLDEMLLAGNAMSRRASYQDGQLVLGGARGTVTTGLGLGVPTGTVTLIPPTDEVTGPTNRDGSPPRGRA